MLAHSLVLFVHVTAAMGVFAALGIEGLALVTLRRATSSAEIHAALRGFRLLPRLAPLSLAATVLSGIYLASTGWAWRGAWIGTAFAGLILTAIVGAATTGPRVARLGRALAEGTAAGSGPGPRDPILVTSFLTRAALLIGIVFLMTTKPGPGGSVGAMAAAIVAGLLTSLPSLRQGPPSVTARGFVASS
jgi:hypothetical protein